MSESATAVTVLTVAYNSGAFIGDFLASVYACDLAGIELQVVVVDNGSRDNTLEVVSAEFPDTELVRNPVNNYTRALNEGISLSRGDYIVIANNDGVADTAWLQGLLSVMLASPRVGAVQSKILFAETGLLNSVGVEEVEHFYYRDIAFEQPESAQYRRAASRQFLSGGAVMFRREALEAAGKWDEDFILYLEDVDYSIRCRAAGWELMYAPDSVFRHRYHGVTTDALCDYFCSRNRLLLVAKHFPVELPACITSSHFFSEGHYDLLYRSLLQALVKLCQEQGEALAARVLEEVAGVLHQQFGQACYQEFLFQLQLLLGLRDLCFAVVGDVAGSGEGERLLSGLRLAYPDAAVSTVAGDTSETLAGRYDVCMDFSGQYERWPGALAFVPREHLVGEYGRAAVDAAVLQVRGVDALPGGLRAESP
ncbi:MAG: glycosyltransferase family 2 protein [Halioglobus sp.]